MSAQSRLTCQAWLFILKLWSDMFYRKSNINTWSKILVIQSSTTGSARRKNQLCSIQGQETPSLRLPQIQLLIVRRPQRPKTLPPTRKNWKNVFAVTINLTPLLARLRTKVAPNAETIKMKIFRVRPAVGLSTISTGAILFGERRKTGYLKSHKNSLGRTWRIQYFGKEWKIRGKRKRKTSWRSKKTTLLESAPAEERQRWKKKVKR